LARTRGGQLDDGRSGRRADLLGYALRPPLGLPPLPVPKDNSLTPDKIELGRKLFFDRRLSLNNTFSCAMCHVPEQGYTSHEQATAVGIEGRTVRRNSPSLYNVGYAARLFHDGRESSLEQQVWGPLLARNEMGAPSVGYVVEKIRGLPDYAGLFEKSFGRGPSMETLGQAIAAYERTLNSAASPFDRWRFGGQAQVLSPAARRGFVLFTGKAGCAACHSLGERHALFTDQDLHNTGIGYRAAMGGPPATATIPAAPGLSLTLDPARLASVSEAKPHDLGLYEITQNPADRWKYKTPTLRNVALTAPYMHDGSLATLRDVVRFYNRGGVPNENLDPRIRPLNLTDPEIEDLVEFLESLTGSNVEGLVSDALAAPVGDPR
jgi:cytochrome c peroxidase